MKIKFILITLFLSIFPLSLLFSKTVFADTFNISGNVKYSSGENVNSATIDVIDVNSNTTVASTVTGSEGNYQMSINGGTYDILVTPPGASNFSPIFVKDRNVSSNTIVNFTFAPAGSVSLSGHIYDQDGNPMQGVTVLVDQNSIPVQAVTNSSGFYSLQKAPGTYTLRIFGNLATTSPDIFSSSINLNQSRILDVTFPFKRVIVQVQNSNGNPVGNVKIGTSNTQLNTSFSMGGVQFSGYTSINENAGNSTNGSGNVALLLFAGEYNFTAYPPQNSNYAITKLNSVSISSDTTVTMTLVSPSVLSGHIYDQDGNPMQGITIVVDQNGTPVQTTTNSSGFYSLQKAPGSYPIRIFANLPNTSPDIYSPSINLSQNKVLDINLPFKRVTIHVQDSNGSSVENVRIGSTTTQPNASFMVDGIQFTGNTSVNENTGNHTDSNGNAEFLLFAGNYNFQAYPPQNSNFVVTQLNGVSVSFDTTIIMTLISSRSTLSGHIYDQDGNPMQGVTVLVDQNSIPVQAVTNSSGFYSLQKAPGTYTLRIFGNLATTSPDIFSSSINLNQNRTLDVTFPFKKVTVHAQDSYGAPIENVRIGTSNTQPSVIFSADGVQFTGNTSINENAGNYTLANGNVNLLLFAGNYNFTAYPPQNSIYTTIALNNINIISDQTEIISLQFNHAAPITTAALSPEPIPQGYLEPTTVELSATADTGYAVANSFYKIDGGSQQTYTSPFNVSGVGEHTIEYWSVDNSGVTEAPKATTFTIVATYDLSGVVYHDDNQNGLQDEGENGYEGAEISLSTGQTTTTDNNGNYSYTNLIAGIYTETLTVPNGYITTTANPAEVALSVDTIQNFGITIAPTATPTPTNTPTPTPTPTDTPTPTPTDTPTPTPIPTYILTGVVFNDNNSNGFQDEGETGFSGAVVSLDTGENTTTDTEGEYMFSDLFSGTYIDTLTVPAGYVATTTNPVTVPVSSDTTVNFGIALAPTNTPTPTSTPTPTPVNVAPVVESVTPSGTTIAINNPITFTGVFTDVNPTDTHTASWNWGDGSTSNGTVSESNGNGTVVDAHTYSTTGVYTVTLTVTDNSSASDSFEYQYITIYDPSNGWATGDKEYSSPAGSVLANPSITGSADFGFTARYVNGVLFPVGNKWASVSFPAGNIEFTASTYQSLVIVNNKITLRGIGTLNNAGGYSLLVSAIDGGPQGTSFVRYQIKNSLGMVIYDTQPGASDTANPTTVVTKGKIQIH